MSDIEVTDSYDGKWVITGVNDYGMGKSVIDISAVDGHNNAGIYLDYKGLTELERLIAELKSDWDVEIRSALGSPLSL